ncbi:MAG: polyprenyl synthetase family protein [Prevotellaceae bacterium]|nr:polyprenyl synthetase family protein [Prevotellaceae bacterium]
MDYLSLIKEPIKGEFDNFISLFNSSLKHTDKLQEEIFSRIRNRAGKRMRPMLILLIAKNYGVVNDSTLHAAVGLELLHTASLVHDDVVDESSERRGQASVNALYDNKIAVLIGDYILSTALLHVSLTHNEMIVRYLAELGRTLSNGEILQLNSISNHKISEETYYDVIRQKTAALFEACCGIGAVSAGVSQEKIEMAKTFGQTLGIIFQIRDDIFDYYDSAEIGKPTGNDMAEGKLTLPAIYAVNNFGDEEIMNLAYKVKDRTITSEEIARLVEFTKQNGGIEYAEKCMEELRKKALDYINIEVKEPSLSKSLNAYLDFVIQRNK